MKKKKILIGILLLFIVLVGAFITLTTICSNKNKKEQANEEVIVNQEGTKKALILYQESLFGLTKKIVDETSEIVSKNGYSVTTNHPRGDLTYNVAEYDVVIFATPVYAKKVSTPILDYAKSHDFTNTKVYVIVTGKMTNELGEIEEVTENVNTTKEVKGIKIDSINEDFKTFANNID